MSYSVSMVSATPAPPMGCETEASLRWPHTRRQMRRATFILKTTEGGDGNKLKDNVCFMADPSAAKKII
ncbi:hypothetical protein T265_01673 [Opisthorchis viverrini]|uniref:Uncharacterized protein n=1 Tax=Opisthorchis viverrini TaxID=6198 RepID=A0A074ZYV1_OPIVI|nr:hypothetical protein T265_01673 [Opisthorchis viverrini]KER32241.1 hypothetical protein T265_01673 [Opisthorchis viverrini]